MSKKYITDNIKIDGQLLDGSGSAGTSGQVLSSTATGTSWVSGSGLPGGPYLPLAGGTMTGNLILNDNVELRLGTSSDFKAGHTGAYTYLYNYTGHMYLRNFADNSNITFQTDDGSGGYTTYLNLDGSTGHAYFSNYGNVGIGETNPGAKLEVSDSLTQPALLLTSDGGNEQFKIRRYSNNNEQLILGFHSSDYAQIQAVEQGVAYRYLVLNPNGGNVGIGITNPGYKLEVSGNAQFEDYIRITNSGGGQRILFGNQDSARVNNPSVILGANGNTYIGGGNSWTGNGGTIDYTATFLDNGYVGIGTTTPSTNLHVKTTSNAQGVTIQRASTTAGAYGQLSFLISTSDTATPNVYLRGYRAAAFADNYLTISTNSAERIRIDGSGNVGINETNPLVPLHISKNTASGENIALILDNNNTTAGNEIGMLFRSAVGFY